jgi:hypothetical protein
MAVDDPRIIRHCAQLDRCNQRGGRMLSVLDLIDAGTLDLDLAAYLMALITRGASFIVGAKPGGAGKTTVMCALLNLIPLDMEIVAATPDAVHRAVRDDTLPKSCYVCHEIGRGRYFAYLWGADLRAYFSLLDKGHVLATNLHADDLDEAREQICTENLVPAAHLNACNLALFVRMGHRGRGTQRWIEKVYVSDGNSPHRLVFDAQTTKGHLIVRNDDSVPKGRLTRCRRFLEDALRSNVRTIEETRRRVVDFLERG